MAGAVWCWAVVMEGDNWVRSPVWSFLAEGRGELQSCKVWKPEAEVQPYKGVLPAGGCYDVAGQDSVSGGDRCRCCVAEEMSP